MNIPASLDFRCNVLLICTLIYILLHLPKIPILVLYMHKHQPHRCSMNSSALLICFVVLLNETTVPKMTWIATCPSNSPLLGRLKACITSSPREGEKLFPCGENLEKTDWCLFLLLLNWALAAWCWCPHGHVTHLFSPLTSHTRRRRGNGGGPRWQPSLALQTVPEIHVAVIQLVSARGCRLLDETPWSMAVDLYPFWED